MEDKGFLNKLYDNNNEDSQNNQILTDELKNIFNICNKEKFLEISLYHSDFYKFFLDYFKEGSFISDDSYEALLTYHFTKKDNKKINVYNYSFTPNKLSSLNINESYDFVFSSYGLSYENIYTILPQLIGFLKIDGILFIELPAYWFFRENLNQYEKDILNYSKTNDKKWIFTEPIDSLIKESGGNLLYLKEINNKKIIDRHKLSYLSSLNKLYKAHIENNIAVLEVANIPENNIELRSAILVVQKEKKTLTKNNLFNF